MKKLKFYEFNQNNSGGSFDVNDKLCHNLFIQAHSYEEAKEKAESFGVYFDGSGDCPCCGNRWSDYNDNALKFPKIFGDKTLKTIKEYAQYLADEYGWTTPDCRIFYKNGKIVEINSKKR